MEFTFMSAAGAALFVRDDAESAQWEVETYSLDLSFPYIEGKVIQRGQQILFTAPNGEIQIFEARTVKNYEPDHYQEIHAEHIALAELTDRHTGAREVNNETPATVLASILTGTGWSVGTVSATNTSSGNLTIGSVWQNIHTIEQNWNVYIVPRVTAAGGRYLDILAAGAKPFHGVRLSLDKNADEMGVTYDDTNTITAMYGYGKQTDGTPLTFASVTWSATSDHPAKPSGQTYLEDPAATAAYGRNGAPRFGYYQNGNIDNAETLLEKTWESLKTTNAPRVTIDCMVSDLYRLGYTDEKIELHDMALVEIRPIGTVLQLEIIKLTIDLLDPTATRPTIGQYIPNIVYIQRVVADMAAGDYSGGGATDAIIRSSSGGGGRGGGNGRGSTAAQQQISEFETEITANQYQISLRAYQRDMTNVETIIKQAGVAIESGGVIVYAGNNLTDMKGSIEVNSDKVSIVVDDNKNVKAASIVAAVNSSGSSVTINADKIVLSGETVATAISGLNADYSNLVAGNTTATTLRASAMYGDTVNTQGLWVHNGSGYVEAEWQSQYVITGLSVTSAHNFRYVSNGVEYWVNGSIITSGPTGETIYYLGR